MSKKELGVKFKDIYLINEAWVLRKKAHVHLMRHMHVCRY